MWWPTALRSLGRAQTVAGRVAGRVNVSISSSLCRRDMFAPASRLLGERFFSSGETTPPPRAAQPRRAILYAPGSSEKMMRKAAGLPVDTACLDLEDAVAPSKKAAARDLVVELMGSLDFGSTELAVRVNGPTSDHMEEDLRAVLSAKRLPDAVVVPKLESCEELRFLFDRAAKHLPGGGEGGGRPPSLITMVESAMGLLNLRAVFDQAVAGGKYAPLHLEACIFGGDDYCNDVHATPQPGRTELLMARQQAYGLQPIDIVRIDFKDSVALELEAREGAGMGFAGKQIIHPGQIAPVHHAFTPHEDAVAYARGLVHAAEEAAWRGEGAFDYQYLDELSKSRFHWGFIRFLP